MILCFSGTGNSRFIAKQIAQAFDDEIIDLNQKIKTKDVSPIRCKNKLILVTPTYAWRIPRIVSDWLIKTKFIDAKEIYFVMNCGSEIGNAAKYNQQLAKQKQLEYMGTAQIIMPENYIALFQAPEKKQASEIVEIAKVELQKVIDQIKVNKQLKKPRKNLYDRFMSACINPIFYPMIVKADAFYAKDTCIGCGLCIDKCPMNNIVLEKNKPKWGKECTHCMACINYCPKQSIEYGKKSKGKVRYHFEELNEK